MPAKQSRTKSALGGKKSKGSSRVPEATKKFVANAVKKHVHRMHISKTANGKFLVDHEFKSAPGEPPIDSEQHAINPEDLSAHVGENLGIGGTASPEPELPPASAAPTLPPAGPLGGF
jgi:hypothetical protein